MGSIPRNAANLSSRTFTVESFLNSKAINLRKLKSRFHTNHPCNFDMRPCKWTCVVKSYVRISTFYSAQELVRVPTFTAARDKDRGVLKNKTVAKVREYPKFYLESKFSVSIVREQRLGRSMSLDGHSNGSC